MQGGFRGSSLKVGAGACFNDTLHCDYLSFYVSDQQKQFSKDACFYTLCETEKMCLYKKDFCFYLAWQGTVLGG